ncbi:DnaD domain protein [Bacillus toyonensis]|uniref:DnaD domain protein n=1 Tax=Bacillus toyonensis TaxID=155322 RepID=UPI003D247B2A
MEQTPQTDKLLFNESPYVIQKSLAMKVGVDESLFIQQLHYLIVNKEKGSNFDTFKDGHTWVYNTWWGWQEFFPFWNQKKIQRMIKKLEDTNILVGRKDLNKEAYDKTKWYRIDYSVLLNLPDNNYFEKEGAMEKEKKRERILNSMGQNVLMRNSKGSNDAKEKKEPLNPTAPTLGQNVPIEKDKMSQPIPKNSLPKNSLSLFSKYVSINMSPINYFKEAISTKPSKYVQMELEALTEKYGKDIVNESIKRVMDLNTNKYIATIKGIINRWEQQGMKNFEDIQTVEQVYAENKKIQKQQPKAKTAAPKRNKREELVPEWLKEEKAAEETAATIENPIMTQEHINQLKEFLLMEAQNLQKEINVSELTIENFNTLGVYINMGFTLQEATKVLKNSPLMYR